MKRLKTTLKTPRGWVTKGKCHPCGGWVTGAVTRQPLWHSFTIFYQEYRREQRPQAQPEANCETPYANERLGTFKPGWQPYYWGVFVALNILMSFCRWNESRYRLDEESAAWQLTSTFQCISDFTPKLKDRTRAVPAAASPAAALCV